MIFFISLLKSTPNLLQKLLFSSSTLMLDKFVKLIKHLSSISVISLSIFNSLIVLQSLMDFLLSTQISASSLSL